MTVSLPPTDPAAVQARLDRLFRNNDRDDPRERATATLRRYVEDYRLPRDGAAQADAAPEVPR
jgi:hypothetical protein